MKKMKTLFSAFAVSILVCFGCKTADVAPNYNGPEQVLGNGKVFTWAKFGADKKPTTVGFTMTKGALENLSHTGNTTLTLTFANDVIGETIFNHVFLDFSHSGHDPQGVYDIAHFDCHFVMQSVAERSAIPLYSPSTAAKFDNLPAAGMIPAPYFRLPAGVPQMGVHWADPTSPELNGKKFTETFIMGSYDGKMTFYEPMITLELLNSKPNITKAAPVPTKFAKAGYYPTKYSIKQVGDNIEISLDELTLKQ